MQYINQKFKNYCEIQKNAQKNSIRRQQNMQKIQKGLLIESGAIYKTYMEKVEIN